MSATATKNVGRIEEIQGVVIEAVFPGELPEINHAITIDRGEQGVLVCEVQQHLGDDRVRAVAMDSTDGLARGMEVGDTGGPITVPVGPATLGRIFNVLGDADRPRRPGRRRGALADPPSRPDGRGPHPDHRDVRDRHQGRRPARALRQGRQGRPVRRRRRRQDGPHPGADPQPRQGARRPVRLLRRRRALPRGQRPVARDEGVGRHRQDDARLRPDERAPGRPHARRAVRPDDGGVLPRRRARTCCCSSTTSSASCRPAPRSPPCWAACPRRSATSRRSSPRWGSCRSASPRPARARSPRSRRSTCRPTTSPTRRRPRCSPTSTRRRCCRARSRRRASTRRSTRSTRPRRSSSRTSSARSTTTSPTRSSRSSSATRSCRTSSRSSASTSSPTRTSSSCSARARSSASSRSRSTSPSSSPARPGAYVPIAETIRGFKEIIEGKHDELPERVFLLKGTIDDVVAAAKG